MLGYPYHSYCEYDYRERLEQHCYLEHCYIIKDHTSPGDKRQRQEYEHEVHYDEHVEPHHAVRFHIYLLFLGSPFDHSPFTLYSFVGFPFSYSRYLFLPTFFHSEIGDLQYGQ